MSAACSWRLWGQQGGGMGAGNVPPRPKESTRCQDVGRGLLMLTPGAPGSLGCHGLSH